MVGSGNVTIDFRDNTSGGVKLTLCAIILLPVNCVTSNLLSPKLYLDITNRLVLAKSFSAMVE